MMEEQLKGTIVPLIRPEQFKLYTDLGMPKQLDRQVAKFVEHFPAGSVHADGPCFKFRKGADLDKLIQHWPACPTKHGRDLLPSVGDQILRTKADLLAAMTSSAARCNSVALNPDAEGFPDWGAIADELRSPPGSAFYPVHQHEVKSVAEHATDQLAEKLLEALREPTCRVGSLGAATRRLLSDPEVQADLHLSPRAFLASFLRRHSEAPPDRRTGGLHGIGFENWTWDKDDAAELKWVEEALLQVAAAYGLLVSRKLRALRCGGVVEKSDSPRDLAQKGTSRSPKDNEQNQEVDSAPTDNCAVRANAPMTSHVRPASGKTDSRDTRPHSDLLQETKLSAANRRAGPKSEQAKSAGQQRAARSAAQWFSRHGELAPSVTSALADEQTQRGVFAWAVVRRLGGIDRATPTSGTVPTDRLIGGTNASVSDNSKKQSTPQTDMIAEEEEALDNMLMSMFAADPHRIFLMDRLPQVLSGSRSGAWEKHVGTNLHADAAFTAARPGMAESIRSRDRQDHKKLEERRIAAEHQRRRSREFSAEPMSVGGRPGSRNAAYHPDGRKGRQHSVRGLGTGFALRKQKLQTGSSESVLDASHSLANIDFEASNESIWEMADLVFDGHSSSNAQMPRVRNLNSTLLASTSRTWT